MVELVDRKSAQVISTIGVVPEADVAPEWAGFACITASKGPLNTPVLCETVSDLEAAFGPISTAHMGLVYAQKVLEGGACLYLVRVASASKKQATVTIPGSDGDSGSCSVDAYFKQYGTYGDNYKLVVSEVSGSAFTIQVFNQDVLVDTITASNDESDPNYILDIENELIGFKLTTEQYYAMTANTYQLEGGNDGTSDIEATDYVGSFSEYPPTGVYAFLDSRYPAQMIATFGYTDKDFIAACVDVAERRKDLTVVVDTPPALSKSEVFEWVNATGSYVSTDIIEGYNVEVYWDWCKDLFDGEEVTIPPSVYVMLNSLKSYAVNGPWLPVAGSSRGVISCQSVISQLSQTSERDEMIKNSVNPIYDTGLNGVQIYGNETRNSEDNDLHAAHIARTLVRIRSLVDSYTETKKFELNDSILWSEWVDHVQDKILEPIKVAGGLAWYRATMGLALTTKQEIAKRQVRGRVELQFVPDAEVFILDYVVYASSADSSTF